MGEPWSGQTWENHGQCRHGRTMVRADMGKPWSGQTWENHGQGRHGRTMVREDMGEPWSGLTWENHGVSISLIFLLLNHQSRILSRDIPNDAKKSL